MRLVGMVSTFFLLASTWILAQQPTTPAQPVVFDPTKYPEDWVLAKWEEAMKEVTSLVAKCELTSVDKVFQTKKVHTGQIKYLKTKLRTMGSVELVQKGNKDNFKKYVFTGDFLYQYMPELKVIRAHPMPKGQAGGVTDDSILSLVFGMKGRDAKQRYQLKYGGGDKHYYYLFIKAKTARDKTDFTQARLTLLRTNFMLRQLWFEEPNGNETFWDFPKVNTNANLRVIDFAKPAVPPGWSLQLAPRNGKPRIIRNQP